MIDFFKALYDSIISIFNGELGSDSEKNGIFEKIKALFDNLFSSATAE